MGEEYYTQDRLVSRAEIAGLAGVGRSAVTNWVRRHEDFPVAVRSGGAEYFRLADVIRWLDTRTVPRGVGVPTKTPPTTYGNRVRAALEQMPHGTAEVTSGPQTAGLDPGERAADRTRQALAELLEESMLRQWGALSLADYLPLPMCLTFLRWAVPDEWERVRQSACLPSPRDTYRFLDRVGAAADISLRPRGVLPDMVAALGQLAPERGADPARLVDLVHALDRAAFRMLLDVYAEAYALDSRAAFTPQAIADLLGGLSIVDGPLHRILDPCTRGGELLTAVLSAHDEDQSPEVHAMASDGGMLRLAAMHLVTHGVTPRSAAVVPTPWQADGGAQRPADDYNFVVANPPFNASSTRSTATDWRYGTPPPSNDNFGWLQYVLSRLRSGGRAAVVMADNAAASDQPREQASRKAMLEDGVIECLIALPSHLFKATDVSACIWILRTPVSEPAEVLFVNARQLGSMVARTRRELDQSEVQLVLDLYRAFRSGQDLPDMAALPGDRSVVARAVAVSEIRQQNYSLNPFDYVSASRLTAASGDDAAGALKALRRSQDAAYVAGAATETLWAQEERSPGGIRLQVSKGWERRPLGEVCTVQAGPSPSLLNPAMFSPDGEVPVVLPKHLRDRYIQPTDESRTSSVVARRLDRFVLQSGDILCTRTGTVGPSALVGPDQAGYLFSGNLLRLHKFAAHVDPRYLLAFLSLPDIRAWIRDRSGMTTVASLKTSALRQLLVLLPPLEEQQRIGVLLHSLDQQLSALRDAAAATEHAHNTLVAFLIDKPLTPLNRAEDDR
ncbi:N-6 DNA methylase [Streptomyces sp. NPDC090442]|uniref:N-6 DNA methylase n=1 Tax=Streptomyces sp. NPDC090442 TaxID=3365962 RepID=UPI0037FE09F9